jgi:epsilon-lactone hydrolase
MPSVQNSISLLCLKLGRHQSFLSSSDATQRHMQTHYLKADNSPSQKMHRYFKIQRHWIRSRDVYTLQAKNSTGIFTHTVNIIYIHGGAFLNELSAKQWEFLGTIVNTAAHQGINVIFTVPIYSLVTPELHTKHSHAHAVMGFLKAVHRSTMEKANGWGDLHIMGDEAGGGLAYSLAVALDNRSGMPAPRRIILLSPWLDISLKNPAIKRLERKDPTNRLEGLKEAGRLFAQGTDAEDPILSPLHAKVDKSILARIYVWTSDADICQADCMTLVYLASKKGVDMTTHPKDKSKRYSCMSELYPSWMFATWTPEARRTIGEIVSVIKEGATSQRSPSSSLSDQSSRRRSTVTHIPKGRSWSSGSINARPRGKSVHGVWGVPEVPKGGLVNEPLPSKTAKPMHRNVSA